MPTTGVLYGMGVRVRSSEMVRHPQRLLAPEVGEILVRRPVPPPVDVRRDLAVADQQEACRRGERLGMRAAVR